MGRGVAALCGMISILLTGCSTIVKATQQQVSVATPPGAQAMCTLSSLAVGTRTVTRNDDSAKEQARRRR